MILIDTSVWIDHLRAGEVRLQGLLGKGFCLTHPLVVGELAMGNLRQRDLVLDALQDLPRAMVAREDEVLRFIAEQKLYGLGIGYIDAHLLTSVRMTPEALLWTRDKRLSGIAGKLGLSAHGYV